MYFIFQDSLHIGIPMDYSSKAKLSDVAMLMMCVLLLFFANGCNRETSPEAISRGQAALSNGNYTEAATHLKRAAKLNSNNEVVHFNLGMAYLLSAEYKSAVKAFEKAEKLNTDGGTSALEGLAEAYRQMGEYDKAQNAIRRAYNKVNRKAHLVAAYAACEMEQGYYASAEKLLSEALTSDPKDPVALFNMAVFNNKPYSNEPQIAAKYYVNFLIVANKTDYAKERARAVEAIREINDRRSYEVQEAIDKLMVEAASIKDPGRAAMLISEAYGIDRSNPHTLWSLARKLDEANRPRDAKRMRLIFAEVFPYDERSQRP